MSEPITLELAKIVVDTSYYGWLINYAQLSNMIAKEHGVDFEEMCHFQMKLINFSGLGQRCFQDSLVGIV